MNSMQLHEIALNSDLSVVTLYFAISLFIHCTNISTIDESDYRRGKTSFEYVNVRC